MKILRKSCAAGAREAEGIAVVIDVFRAFSCAPLFFYLGARKVLLEPDPEKARGMKLQNPSFILVGEHNEVPLPDADLGNSPSQILLKGKRFFQDRTVIHRTTAGVTGVAAAGRRAREVLLGSFMLASATARYIHSRSPDVVTLVAMGDRAQRPAPEDEACADCLEHLLAERTWDPLAALREVVFQPTAQKFISASKPYLPPEDPLFCLQRNLFDFALRAEQTKDGLEVKLIPSRAAAD